MPVREFLLRIPQDPRRSILLVKDTSRAPSPETEASWSGQGLFEAAPRPPLAQFYGIGLTLAQQVTVVLICILRGIGTAGVPAGSIPVVVMILGLVGVPAEGISMIIRCRYAPPFG